MYRIVVSGMEGIALATPDEVALQGAELRSIPATVRVAHGSGAPGPNKIAFELKAIKDDSVRVKEKASFFVPR